LRFLLLSLLIVNSTLFANSDPDFNINFPDEKCVNDSFRLEINSQVNSVLFKKQLADLKFYSSLRESIILEHATDTQSKLDTEMFFIIHRILNNIENTESNKTFFINLKNELLTNPLIVGERNLNDRVLPNIDKFIRNGT
jgi:hypothetical protein